jgi:hypothetical protein
VPGRWVSVVTPRWNVVCCPGWQMPPYREAEIGDMEKSLASNLTCDHHTYAVGRRVCQFTIRWNFTIYRNALTRLEYQSIARLALLRQADRAADPRPPRCDVHRRMIREDLRAQGQGCSNSEISEPRPGQFTKFANAARPICVGPEAGPLDGVYQGCGRGTGSG